MPQMAPINWLSLFIIFFIMFILFNVMNYFSYLTINMNYNINKNLMTNPLNWKW